jgi:hypothetical protein
VQEFDNNYNKEITKRYEQYELKRLAKKAEKENMVQGDLSH